MIVQCPNQHSVEVHEEQFGQGIICPECRVRMFVTPPRAGGGGGVKYEIRCPVGHALRVKTEYLYQHVPCPTCQRFTFVEPSRLRYYPLLPSHPSVVEEEPIVVGEVLHDDLARETQPERPRSEHHKKRRKYSGRMRIGLRNTSAGLNFLCNYWWLDGILNRLITMITYFRCLSVPAETGAKLWINLAFWPLIASIFIGLGMIILALSVKEFTEGLKALFICLAFVIVLPQLLSPFFFVAFLARLAEFLGKKKLSQQIMHQMPWGLWGMLQIIFFLVGSVSLLLAVVDRTLVVPGLLGFVITLLGFLVITVIKFFTLLVRMGDLRNAIENSLEVM